MLVIGANLHWGVSLHKGETPIIALVEVTEGDANSTVMKVNGWQERAVKGTDISQYSRPVHS